MIIIEKTISHTVDNWKDARAELRALGILLPDYAVRNMEAGRPFSAPISEGGRFKSYVTVRYAPGDAK